MAGIRRAYQRVLWIEKASGRGEIGDAGVWSIDLNNLDLGEFTATGDMYVGPNHWIVAKKDVPYELWNRLTEVESAPR